MRLDLFLVENRYCETRQKAQCLIKDDRVAVNGKQITKVSYNVEKTDSIEILKKEKDFVSFGGFKLQKAIDDFNISFENSIILDVGASTGGFTDCAIQNGAKLVYAVDVGTNQLHWSLRNNKKVIFFENTDIRNFNIENLGQQSIDFIVADLSFISITKYFDSLLKFISNDCNTILLIKPQFEAGIENIGRNGIVINKNIHLKILKNIEQFLNERGFFISKLTFAPILKNKNIEYLVLISKQNCSIIEFKTIISEAFTIQKTKQ